MQAYSDPSRETDPHALPDIEVFQLTDDEAAELADEDTIWEARKSVGGPCMSSRDRQHVIDTIIKETGPCGGWYWQACFPGCLPDSDPCGPFASKAEALADAQDNCEE